MKKQISLFITAVLMLAILTPFSSVADSSNVSISMTPHNLPVVIQPSGGTFDYFIEVANNNPNPLQFQIWTTATLPDSSLFGPVTGPKNFLLPGGWSASAGLSQYIPASAPAGIYTFFANIGLYPGAIFATDSFTLEKLAASTPWFEQNSGTTEVLRAIHFVDPDNGWIVGVRNTILHTMDGGENWYDQNPDPSVNYNDLHFVDTLCGWAVGSLTKTRHTEDGGATWVAQDSGSSGENYGVFFIDNLTGWIVGGKEVSFTPPSRFINHTTDGGQTWTNQFYQSNKNPLQDIFFIDAQTGWAVGYAGSVLLTTDGGASWNEVTNGAPYELRSVFFTDALHGFTVGRESLYSSSDGGLTWTSYPIAPTLTLTEVTFTDSLNGWAVGGWTDNTSMILHTNDGGATWNEQDATTPNSLAGVSFVDSLTGWAIDYKGLIIKTISGGN